VLTARLGISPIAWWNDDFDSLGVDVCLQQCLRDVQVAGFSGIETARRFPTTTAVLQPLLAEFGLAICGGWFAGQLLFKALDAPCLVYGETANSIQGDLHAPLSAKPTLDAAALKTYGRKLTLLAAWCLDQGVPLAFHPHVGAVIECEQELDQLMAATDQPLGLVLDTGHIALTGGDVLQVISHHHERIIHVHAKDVRRPIVDALVPERDSFLDAVCRGVFTVPGDGALNLSAIIRRLAAHRYQGWFVVEAEQDPPAQMASQGYQAMHRALTAAGYSIHR
jgi:inosose dehydratase